MTGTAGRHVIHTSEDAIETPFDIEAILNACPRLCEKWCNQPFFLDLDEEDRVVIKYFVIGDEENVS
jgi:hypothetical protein